MRKIKEVLRLKRECPKDGDARAEVAKLFNLLVLGAN